MKFFVREGVLVLILLFLATGLGFGQNTAEQIWTKGIEYGAQGKFKEAKEEFEKALKVDPSFKTVERFLKLIEDVNQQKKKSKTAISYFKGVACQLKRRWDEAIDEYNKAIEINPEYACAYNARGHAYYIKGQYDKAISDFTKAIKLNPRNAEAYNDRGITYDEGKSEYDKAISDFTKAIELNPKDAKAYNNRGNAYVKKGQFDKAISDYTKAIEINPRNATAYYYNRGSVYDEEDQYDKAISDYTKAIELNSRYAYAYKNRGFVYMVRLGNKIKACSDWKWACALGSCEDYKLAKRKGDCK